MRTRRDFLLQSTAAGVAVATTWRLDSLALLEEAGASLPQISPEQAARDESFWNRVRKTFTLAPDLINLNSGLSPSPRTVQEEFKRELDYSNLSPLYHLENILEPKIEAVRRRAAEHFGCISRSSAWKGRRRVFIT